MQYQEFGFLIAGSMTEAQINDLWDLIIGFCDELGLEVAGGNIEKSDADFPESETEDGQAL